MKSTKICLGWCVLGAMLVAAAGCQSGSSMMAMKMPDWSMPSFDWQRMEFRAQSKKDKDDGLESKVETEVIGKYTTVSGLNMITLEGVGLVVGLDGTGGDPPPSQHRAALLKDMRRRKVPQPNNLLKNPNTALVVVRAYLPPLIRKGDRFDIEVRLPDGSEATSLNGGWLLETHLSERAIVPGKGLMKGHIFAKAAGPILISAQDGDKDSLAGVLRRGVVLGGGLSLKERDLFLDVRSDFRGRRNVVRITDSIGKRFFSYNKHGLRESLAEAKTDQRINLKVHPKYRDNYPRYLQVIRNLAFQESRVEKQIRIQKLKNDLQDPVKAEKASIQLEAIGQEGVPILKTGLRSADPEVRFHSAVALAYLGEPDGLKVLAEAARDEPAFRIFALAAMATVNDNAESFVLLRNLMNEPSAETRYGAFRALTTLDKNDPLVRGEALNDEFKLHVMDSTATPMIHLTRHKKSEVVLFGADQRLNTPVALRAGRHILVTAPARSGQIVVSRFDPGEPDRRKIISNRVADVIRTVAEFGASYPEIAQLLTQASNNGNIEGKIEIDALPEAGRVYYRGKKANDPKSTGKKTYIGVETRTPNLFSNDIRRKKDKAESDRGTASLTNLGDDDEPTDKPKKKKPAEKTAKKKWYDPFGLLTREDFVSPK